MGYILKPNPPCLMSSLSPPTTTQLEILDFIRYYLIRHGHPPTLREIATRFGFARASGAAYHVKAMVKKGLLRPDRNGQNPRYIPAECEVIAIHDPDGAVRVGTTGPAVFTPRAWRVWLLRELAATTEERSA